MRILLVHNFYQSSAPSGEDVVFRAESELLARAGHEVIQYTRGNDDIGSSVGGRLRAARDLFWSPRSYAELSDLLVRHRPEVAHFHNTHPLISASAYQACRDAGVPVLQTLHNYRLVCPGALLLRDGLPCEQCVGRIPLGSVVHGCYRHSRAASALVGAAAAWNHARGTYTHEVDRYLCLTAFARERFVRGGLPSGRLFVKPNTLVDPPGVGGHSSDYCLYVGRLTAEKGVRTLVEAWREAPLTLKIAGDGALRPELEQRVRESGARVEFLGFRSRSEVQALMANCRLLIIPSECYEGFPMTVLEGLASGTPLLVSRIGALDELLEEEQHCRKFEPRDPRSLSRALQVMLADPESTQRMSGINRRLFDERYSPGAVTSLLLDHYAAVRTPQQRH